MQTPDLQVDGRFEQDVQVVKESPEVKYRLIDISKLLTDREKRIAYRLNSLGSLYFFIKTTLRRNRLVEHLHKPICDNLERFHLKEVIEFPRDHYKTVIHSEGAPMWWALPFTDSDEFYFRKLGYGDSFIRWMRRAHDRDTRNLLISENITNAKKIGYRIAHHYANNDLFRGLFPEILPDEKCKWTEEALHHKRTKSSPNGEGTYDFLGVGGALQSRHYERVVQDDLIGKAALKSETVMQSTIEYFRLLVGAFDSSSDNAVEDNDEIVVGNRWSEKDLNRYIRDETPYFHFTNHSAEGGCCPQHAAGLPIFPEQFSIEKLIRWKMRLGTYLYSCQFLNNPTAPGSTRWSEDLLNFYDFDLMDSRQIPQADGSVQFVDPRIKIVHYTKNGVTYKELMPRELILSLIVDPNHSEQQGRSRHAIIVTGLLKRLGEAQRLYLLDCWAKHGSYDELCNKVAEFVQKWKLRQIWVEGVGFQKFLKYHLDTIFDLKGIRVKVNTDLKTDRSENGKDARIEAMDPIYENGQMFVRRNDLGCRDFVTEFSKYPVGKTKDILDVMGYAPQTWNQVTNAADVKAMVSQWNQNNPYASNIVQGGDGRSQITGY